MRHDRGSTRGKKRKVQGSPSLSFKEQDKEKPPRTDLNLEEVEDDFVDGRSSGGLYNRAEESQWSQGDMAEEPGEDEYEEAVWEGEGGQPAGLSADEARMVKQNQGKASKRSGS